MQIKKQPKVYDVVVIGSGASGGMAAWNLTRQGINVLLLDAGERFESAKFWMGLLPYERRELLQSGQRPYRFFLSPQEQPLLTPPDLPFNLYRVWGWGGKTNVWGRVSLRYSDLDFQVNDGYGIPWPLTYRDLKSYYDQVDQLIGVCGGDEDLDVLPGSQYHLPPLALRCGEIYLKRAAARLGIQVVSTRRANLTRAHRGRAQCHYCGDCGSGCSTGSFFNAGQHLIPEALRTGRLEVTSHAVVSRILPDPRTGLADRVQYFHRQTGQEYQVKAKVVVVGASCIDSTRILLNSKSTLYPNGIGNTSGVLGKNLCEQFRFHVYGFLPQLYGRETTHDSGIGGEHIYLPRFNHRGRRREYARGFGMQFWGTGCQAGAGWAKDLAGFGPDFKREVKQRYPAWIAAHPYGEIPPRPENRVEVDETRLDRYGVPLPRIILQHGANERQMANEMYDTVEQLFHEAKAELWNFQRGRIDTPGEAIHEHGTCRMGADPKNSMLNQFCQMHAVKNLFVVDGSAFPSATEKNPTLTILAVSWRATDYLANQIKKGNL
ncbi:MAG TPA: GMC family oxidoreductase [Blastocatellia bacterium]|nr:GMC family oxidoreductase [Blastocatellia bacterium]